MKNVEILRLFDDVSKGKAGSNSAEIKVFHVRESFEVGLHNTIYGI